VPTRTTTAAATVVVIGGTAAATAAYDENVNQSRRAHINGRGRIELPIIVGHAAVNVIACRRGAADCCATEGAAAGLNPVGAVIHLSGVGVF
jgi:hypothetical protein